MPPPDIKGLIQHKLAPPAPHSLAYSLLRECVLTPYLAAWSKTSWTGTAPLNEFQLVRHAQRLLQARYCDSGQFDGRAREMTYMANCPPVGLPVRPRTRACYDSLMCPWCYVRRFLQPLSLSLFNVMQRKKNFKVFVFVQKEKDRPWLATRTRALASHLCFQGRQSPFYWFPDSHGFIQALDYQVDPKTATKVYPFVYPFVACYLICPESLPLYAVLTKLKQKGVTTEDFCTYAPAEKQNYLDFVVSLIRETHQRNWYDQLVSQSIYNGLLNRDKHGKTRTLRISKRK